MRGLRESLTSRGFNCGADQQDGGRFPVKVPPDFPSYYDVVGRGYVDQGRANSINTLRNYLERALALVQNGGAYRTEAEARASTRVSAKTSRYTGVRREQENWRRIWRARISVRGSSVDLGAYDDEEGAARAYDAALVKYRNAPTVNFPGETPTVSVLAALPALFSPHLAQPVPAPPPPGAPRRSGRAPVPKAPKVIVDPPAPVRRRKRGRDTSQGAKKRKTQSREERRAKQRACRQARRQRKKEEKVARRRRIRAYAEKRKRRRELEDDAADDDDPGATASSTSPSLA